MTPHSLERRPEFSFDMDGVICRPPMGVNVTIARRMLKRPMPTEVSEQRLEDVGKGRRMLMYGLDVLRFFGRVPMPDAVEGLAAIYEFAQPVLVTGRSFHGYRLIDRWLQQYGMRQYFSELLPNHTPLGGAQYKLWTAQRRGIAWHVDDDGSVVEYLARNGLGTVFLRDWPRNRGLPYPPNVVVIHRLSEIARHLAAH